MWMCLVGNWTEKFSTFQQYLVWRNETLHFWSQMLIIATMANINAMLPILSVKVKVNLFFSISNVCTNFDSEFFVFFSRILFFFGFRFASNIQSVSISNMFLNEEWEERKVKFYYIILMQWSREHDAHYWFASVIRFKIHLHNSFCRQGIVLRLQNYFESKLAQNHTFDRPNWDFGKFENFRKSISNSS